MNNNRNQSSVTKPDNRVSSTCCTCEKPIADGQWFCRLPQKAEGMAGSQAANILLCSPACALRYFATLETETTRNN
jgi:hypothetical protein